MDGTVLERGRVLPGVELPGPWSAWDARGKKAQVLAFLHAGCDACDAWAREVAEARLDARVVAVVERGAPCELPAVVDERGEARLAFLGPDGEVPTVVVADRYAAAWAAYPAPWHELPSPRELASTLRHADITCSDCAAPGWGR